MLGTTFETLSLEQAAQVHGGDDSVSTEFPFLLRNHSEELQAKVNKLSCVESAMKKVPETQRSTLGFWPMMKAPYSPSTRDELIKRSNDNAQAALDAIAKCAQ